MIASRTLCNGRKALVLYRLFPSSQFSGVNQIERFEPDVTHDTHTHMFFSFLSFPFPIVVLPYQATKDNTPWCENGKLGLPLNDLARSTEALDTTSAVIIKPSTQQRLF